MASSGRILAATAALSVLSLAAIVSIAGSDRSSDRSISVACPMCGHAFRADLPETAKGGGEPSRDKPLKVVCFGDSITGHRPGESYQGTYLKYSDLLGLMLEGRLGVGKAKVINSGWAGDMTYPQKGQSMPGAVDRLKKDLLDHEPDIAVVLIGGNDRIESQADRKRTLENLTAIYERLRKADIHVLALQYPPVLPDPNDPSKAWEQIPAKNPLIVRAAKAARVKLLDMGPAMKAAAREFTRSDLADPVDGVHLRPRGEMVFARTIFAELVDLGWVSACGGGESGKKGSP
jgi:lysophospholipase L1-like esterase